MAVSDMAESPPLAALESVAVGKEEGRSGRWGSMSGETHGRERQKKIIMYDIYLDALIYLYI